MTKKMPENFPTIDQIEHLIEHVDQFVAVTGEPEVEKYFKDHPEASYKAICEVLDIEPVETPAEAKALEAFNAMTGREHRKTAQHLVMCPMHGFVGVTVGRPMNTTADKVEALEESKARLEEAIKHIDAAVLAYKSSV